MPNQLPQSNLADRLGLRPEQKPAPINITVNGKVVPVSFTTKKDTWNKVSFVLFIILFVVLPIILGIIELVKHGC